MIGLVYDHMFHIRGEYHDDRLWLHSEVSRWGPRTARKIAAALKHISATFQRDLWVVDNPRSPLLPKFLRMMDFHESGKIQCNGQEEATFVYRHK